MLVKFKGGFLQKFCKRCAVITSWKLKTDYIGNRGFQCKKCGLYVRFWSAIPLPGKNKFTFKNMKGHETSKSSNLISEYLKWKKKH